MFFHLKLLLRRPDQSLVRGSRPIRRYATALAVCACLAASLAGSRADATEIVLSTNADAIIGGLAITDGDLARYDDVTDTSTLAFDESNFSASEDIDAVHILGNGNILLSTAADATIGGVTFRDGDIVEYDPVSDTATLFFNEDLFLTDSNVDALSVLANGNLVISIAIDTTLAGLAFRDGDLVLYDPIGGIASLFFSEDLFATGEDIDGVHVFGDGTIVLSTQNGAILGGLTISGGDLAHYDPVSDTATLFFAETNFGTAENIDAVYVVPEPGTSSLLALGLVLLARRRR